MTAPAPRLLAITTAIPFGENEEVFVQDEVTELHRQRVPMDVVPMRRRQRHPNAASVRSGVASIAVPVALLAPRVVGGALLTLLRRPLRSVRAALGVLRSAHGLRNLGVDLVSLPKALWIAHLIRARRYTHVHAYWLSHSATAGMVAAEIERVPWSGTGYRWDIDAANALDRKLRSAAFLRCADELGRAGLEAAAATVPGACPIELVRTGVSLPSRASWESTPVQGTVLACPASFVEKKGHAVLLTAFERVVAEHPGAVVHLFGDGPLRPDIEARARARPWGDQVVFHGGVPLAELQAFLREHRPTCVLPSIIASDGQVEGIPVTLVEAMANGAPVVSTRSGSIETLVLPGTGTLVPPGDADALADALLEVIADPEAAHARCLAAADRLVGEFDLAHTAARMAELTGMPAGR